MKSFKIISYTLLFVSVLILVGCNKKNYTIKEPEIYLTESAHHKKEEIEKTVDLLKENFYSNDTFKNCTLLEIYYSDSSHDIEMSLTDDNLLDEAIIINFKFQTGKNVHQALNKDDIYYYQAQFIRYNSSSEWVLKSMGIF